MFTLRFLGETQVTSSPSSRTRPESASSKPAIIRSVVVLPHPLGPSIEKNSPAGISRVTSSTARTSPKSFTRRSTTIIGSALIAPP